MRRMRATTNVQLRAKELRKEMTPSEKILWECLRNRRLGGFKFRRQAPMGGVIADFYCAECKILVELDGDIHDLQVNADLQRTQEIESYGYRVIRFRNDEIENDLQQVLNSILDACGLPSPRIGRRVGDEGE